jgi:hypothetical protein
MSIHRVFAVLRLKVTHEPVDHKAAIFLSRRGFNSIHRNGSGGVYEF